MHRLLGVLNVLVANQRRCLTALGYFRWSQEIIEERKREIRLLSCEAGENGP